MGFLDFLKGGKGSAPSAPAPSAQLPTPAGPDLGCLLCGEPRSPATSEARCALCGAASAAGLRCAAGHLTCADCDGAAAADVIERACAASDERDPVALALRLFRHPALLRDGAAAHVLVPSVLAAAWANQGGAAGKADRAARVAEARRRAGADGAGCAPGVCGAAAGAGTFVALAGAAGGANGAAEKDLPAAMTAKARSVVGAKGSTCCKRDALLSILAASRFARENLAIDLPAGGVGCETSGRAASCMGSGCPFNR